MKKKPFRPNGTVFQLKDPAHAFLSVYNEKSYQKLIAGIGSGKKLLTLTGPDGCGKTVLIKRIFQELANDVCLINLHGDNFATVNLIDYMGKELAVDLTHKMDFFEKVEGLAGALSLQAKQHVIILIDQAQSIIQSNLQAIMSQINAIGRSWNAENAPFFQTLVVGASELELQFGVAEFWEFALDEVVQVRLKALNAEETRRYICRYLDQDIESARTLFSESALQRVISYSQGVPRNINKLCDLALLMATMEDATISAALIDEVAENCLIVSDADVKTTFQQERFSVSDVDVAGQVGNKDILPSKPDSREIQRVLEDTAIDAEVVNQEHDLSSDVVSLTRQESAQNEGGSDDSNDVRVSVHQLDWLKIATGIVAVAALGIGAFKLGNFKAEIQTVSNGDLAKTQAKLNNGDQGQTSANSSGEQTNVTVKPEPRVNEHTRETVKADTKGATFDHGADEIQQQSEKKRPPQDLGVTLAPDNNVKQLAKLLALADRQLDHKKLMMPIGDCAWTTYNEVLALSPGNLQALAGIEKIKTTYVFWAKHEISKRNFKHAKYLLSKALEISPDDPDILLMQSEIDIEKDKVSLRKARPAGSYRNRSFLSNDNRLFWYNFAIRHIPGSEL